MEKSPGEKRRFARGRPGGAGWGLLPTPEPVRASDRPGRDRRDALRGFALGDELGDALARPCQTVRAFDGVAPSVRGPAVVVRERAAARQGDGLVHDEAVWMRCLELVVDGPMADVAVGPHVPPPLALAPAAIAIAVPRIAHARLQSNACTDRQTALAGGKKRKEPPARRLSVVVSRVPHTPVAHGAGGGWRMVRDSNPRSMRSVVMPARLASGCLRPLGQPSKGIGYEKSPSPMGQAFPILRLHATA